MFMKARVKLSRMLGSEDLCVRFVVKEPEFGTPGDKHRKL
jgi:hypothetical protein